MKLLWVTPGTFPAPSGKSSSVEQAAVSIATRLSRSVDITMVSRKTRTNRPEVWIDGIRHIRYPRAGYVRAVRRRIATIKPDVIVIENRPLMLSTLKRAVPGARLWLSIHSLTFVRPPMLRKAALRHAFACAEGVLVNSRYMYEQLSLIVPEYAEKLVLNHLGVDLDRFVDRWSEEGELVRTQWLRKLGYRQDQRVILFVGRLQPIKGVHYAIQAMHEVSRCYPEAVLVIVGSAKYGRNETTAYVRALHREGGKLPNHIRFVPFVDHTRIHELYCLADVVVVPSDPIEAFGLVIAEAMASGVTVVATNGGGMRELICDGQTGVLLPPEERGAKLGDELVRLLDDRALLQKLGTAGRARIHEHFTWGHTAQRLLHAIKDVTE